MKLQELIPEEQELLDLTVEKLAEKVLICFDKVNPSTPVRRRGLATRLVMGYPMEFGKSSVLAIEEAIMHLEHQMFIGMDPEEREFVFVTRKGKEQIRESLKELLASTT